MRGVYEAQSRSVHEVREDLRIGATKQLPSGASFERGLIITNNLLHPSHWLIVN
ncbi:hypothetical protein Sarmat_00733 [Rickettsiales endosymbiont of Paramecium tredecaurelia]|uniref:hypothetical protein n=1 Tax=Candidatus Sarmatiella mevalonica TaxID=2770581 RepID=UPI001923CD27|nr:hypothetical protein [Candidatus Sarmatiella mevalonica]MBL3284875.1 hypothetical protein [Candidatus Sarmatiella mevalonica]